MRTFLLTTALLTAGLGLLAAAPTGGACHMPPPPIQVAAEQSWDITGEPPQDGHKGLIDIHSSDCGSDPGFWICYHDGVITQCFGSDY